MSEHLSFPPNSHHGEFSSTKCQSNGFRYMSRFLPVLPEKNGMYFYLLILSGTTTDLISQLCEIYCNSTFDGYLCWAPTVGSEISVQHCPRVRLSDPKQFAFRRCGEDGRWLGKHGNDTNPNGWTNYTPCFPSVVQSLFYKVYDEDEKNGQDKFEIAHYTRIIEIVGFATSLLTLTISLFILQRFKALHNLRTRIHKNLFFAMNAQVILRLIVYIDQAVMRKNEGTPSYTVVSAIENLPYLCITVYVTLEYFITVMFMWMINEGYYLNTLVTSNVLRENTSYKYFCMVGWIIPLCLTGIWATVVAFDYADDTSLRCWYGYNFQNSYWLLQGPRLAVIVINFCFLLNIMRVLVMKLRRDHSSDVVKIRKAVKAAMVLLPLLGITNVLSMLEGPVAGPVWKFATWSYTTHFLRSFQGTFLAILYCLTNNEVHDVVGKSAHNRVAIFRYRYPRLARRLGLRHRHPHSLSSRGRLEDLSGIGGTGRRRGFGGVGGLGDSPGASETRRDHIPLRTLRFWRRRPQNQSQSSDIETTQSQLTNISETQFGGTTTKINRTHVQINNTPYRHRTNRNELLGDPSKPDPT